MRATADHDQLHTPLCDMLSITYPILQAGMGMIARGALAAAVSEAGGLGVIGSAHLTTDELREEVRLVRRLTDKPFGVDILFAIAKAEGAEALQYTKEVEDFVQIVLDERVPVLVSGLGSPSLAIRAAHDIGTTVMSIVGNVRQAKALVSEGVDVIIAQGHEAGGHTGRVGTIVLVPSLVDAVDVPVVAAGGLADGRGVAAALALGAQGAWMGTRFVAVKEAYAHDRYKQKIVEIDEDGTVVTRAHSGKPCRLIRNAFTREWEAKSDEIEPYPLQVLHVGREASRRARLEGDLERGVAPAGQSSGLIHEVKGAAEVVGELVEETRAVLQGLCGRDG